MQQNRVRGYQRQSLSLSWRVVVQPTQLMAQSPTGKTFVSRRLPGPGYGSSTVMCSRPARSMTFTAMGNSGEGVKGRVRWLVIRCHLSASRCG